jgi:hypothetical protein
MANPLYQQLMGGARAPINTPMGNIAGLMQQVNQLAATFRGDPRAEVQKLISSGQMSQAQFNELAAMANTIMGKAQKR